MNTIAGLASAQERIGPFSWLHFRIVRRLVFEQNQEAGVMVGLTLETEDRPTNWRLTIVGRGVQGLRLSNWSRGTRITGFDCVDIADRQWEGLRWEVLDYEDDSLHFYCSDLAIESVERAD